MLKRILVANRGEIACRILRACKEAGIEGVAIHAANDAGTLFTEIADIAVQLEGEGLNETYLNIEQIIHIALENQCDGIHPGFGFLSERAEFAKAVIDAGITWIGPSPFAITQMGDKMTARITMKQAGVPVIPGEEVEGGIEEVLAVAPSVGYPLLLKATAGGGGKGMRAVHDPVDLESEAKAAMREASTLSAMIESMSRDYWLEAAILRSKFSPIGLVEQSILENVNVVFSVAIRRFSKNPQALH